MKATPMRYTTLIAILSGAALTAAGLTGCSRGTQLEPAAAAKEVGDDAAYARVGSVTVLADGDDWPGDTGVLAHVTPVQITVRNHSQDPLRIQYSNMAIVAGEGQRFAALPPFAVPGTVEEEAVGLVEPRFYYEGFEVEPFYGALYRDIPVTARPLDMNRDYYDDLYGQWDVQVDLPTPYMREVALPEGVVRPNGTLSGYVYFQRVPEATEKVMLQVQLVNADSGDPIGTATIPFTTD